MSEQWTCYRLWVDGRLVDQECVRPDATDDQRAAVVNRQAVLADDAAAAGKGYVYEIADGVREPQYAYLQIGADHAALSGHVRIPIDEVRALLVRHRLLAGYAADTTDIRIRRVDATVTRIHEQLTVQAVHRRMREHRLAHWRLALVAVFAGVVVMGLVELVRSWS